ncbi:MAG: MBL fold metallo-hydrolase [Clostridia bacterium]|nr:MBL fold metallo-hydrolase [Clostridia bacterium]
MKRLLIFLLSLILCFSLCAPALAEGEGQLEIHFVNTSPVVKDIYSNCGDCTFIRFPNGETMLIDTARMPAYETVADWLHSLGVKDHIDYFVNSHHHDDHAGGFASLAEHFTFGRVMGANWSPEIGNAIQVPDYFKTLRRLGLTEERLRAGDSMDFGDVHMEVLWPLPDSDLSMDEQLAAMSVILENDLADLNDPVSMGRLQNNHSCVMRFTYGDFSFLTGGDIEIWAEKQILDLYGIDQLESTLFKVSHHGITETSNTPEFMDAVLPVIAVYTAHNSWGLIRNLLREFSIHQYCTGDAGHISIATDGSVVTVTTESGETITEKLN